jgi:hypothetical protein
MSGFHNPECAHLALASVLQEPMNDFRSGGLGASKSLTLRDFYRSLPAEQFPHLVEMADEHLAATRAGSFRVHESASR